MTTVLLLGRTGFVLEDVMAGMTVDVRVLLGTDLADVHAAYADGPVDHVVMGAGIELETRLAIVEAIFRASDATTVHMKDRASGPAGMMPFVNAILTGLA